MTPTLAILTLSIVSRHLKLTQLPMHKGQDVHFGLAVKTLDNRKVILFWRIPCSSPNNTEHLCLSNLILLLTLIFHHTEDINSFPIPQSKLLLETR